MHTYTRDRKHSNKFRGPDVRGQKYSFGPLSGCLHLFQYSRSPVYIRTIVKIELNLGSQTGDQTSEGKYSSKIFTAGGGQISVKKKGARRRLARQRFLGASLFLQCTVKRGSAPQSRNRLHRAEIGLTEPKSASRVQNRPREVRNWP